MKKIFVSLLSMMMLIACAEAPAEAPTAETAAPAAEEPAAPETSGEETVIRDYLLTTGFRGENLIDGYAVSKNAKASVWNAEKDEFEETDLTNDVIRGNYVQLIDNNGDETVDAVNVVLFNDSSAYWDATMFWMDGAGEADPGIPDEIGYEVYGKEYVIPFGERLLTGIGLGEWSGTVDFWNHDHDEISYYNDLDFYNLKSTDTLTMLTGYKTRLQPTGWTCGLSSALSVLDWYGLRGDLNDYDLANIRTDVEWGHGMYMENEMSLFESLKDLGVIGEYTMKSSLDDPYALMDPSFVKGELEAGHPILVVWNAFGWHWQVIIGYDDMGTPDIPHDDVLIMMDPYDTTDQNANGYYVEPYQRLIYGVSPAYGTDENSFTFYCVFAPNDFTYTPEKGDAPAALVADSGDFSDNNKMGYGKAAEDIQKYYPETEWLGDNGLAGPATGGIERTGDHKDSPYWVHKDFYNLESNDTLKMLTNFKTYQQTTEWTCGLASELMVMNWFDKAETENDITLAQHRQEGKAGATSLDGMIEVLEYMNDTYSHDWVWVSTYDLDDPDGEESYIGDYCLQAGTDEEWYGLIPYLLENGIPVMVGSDEWGGHWQVLIGYDDMGTIDRTEDDVIIFADPYDTTDHNQDGYVIDGFERLVFGWYSGFEETFKHNDFIAAFPLSGNEAVAEALGISK